MMILFFHEDVTKEGVPKEDVTWTRDGRKLLALVLDEKPQQVPTIT
jgi:hypothetical protein